MFQTKGICFLVFKTERLEDTRSRAGNCAVAGVRERKDELRLLVDELVWEKASALVVYQLGNESLLTEISLNVESEEIKFHIPFHLKSLKKHCEPEKGY